MRGLVQFIADLRNARARELEEKRINKELANIRQKFKGEKLDGYQKKKYVCKLLYIYIQGYNVDFGHLEAVNLISAKKYSEKQIGYLAVTLFLHEQHELLHLVVNSIRKDLLITMSSTTVWHYTPLPMSVEERWVKPWLSTFIVSLYPRPPNLSSRKRPP